MRNEEPSPSITDFALPLSLPCLAPAPGALTDFLHFHCQIVSDGGPTTQFKLIELTAFKPRRDWLPQPAPIKWVWLNLFNCPSASFLSWIHVKQVCSRDLSQKTAASNLDRFPAWLLMEVGRRTWLLPTKPYFGQIEKGSKMCRNYFQHLITLSPSPQLINVRCGQKSSESQSRLSELPLFLPWEQKLFQVNLRNDFFLLHTIWPIMETTTDVLTMVHILFTKMMSDVCNSHLGIIS